MTTLSSPPNSSFIFSCRSSDSAKPPTRNRYCNPLWWCGGGGGGGGGDGGGGGGGGGDGGGGDGGDGGGGVLLFCVVVVGFYYCFRITFYKAITSPIHQSIQQLHIQLTF